MGLTPAQQARLVALAPSLAPVSLSLNSSAIYLGSAMGATVGALVTADGANGAARLGGGGVQPGRAAARTGQRQQHITRGTES